MTQNRRGISTVADVSLALLIMAVAMSVILVLDQPEGSSHDHVESDRTAELIAGSTVNTTYSIQPVLDAAREDEALQEVEDPDDWNVPESKTKRVSHGPIAGQIADAAVTNLQMSGTRLTPHSRPFGRAVEQALQSRILESDIHSNVTAVWRPYDGAQISGSARFGRRPPPGEDVSSTTITVPSGIPAISDDQAARPANRSLGYETVADSLARALVSTLLPKHHSQRALESSGTERILTVSRYIQVARSISDDVWDVLEQRHLERASADAGTLNSALGDGLADTFARQLASDFESPAAAAAAVSIEHVTITVRTWQP